MPWPPYDPEISDFRNLVVGIQNCAKQLKPQVAEGSNQEVYELFCQALDSLNKILKDKEGDGLKNPDWHL
jgi:hypothetical protein